MEKFNIKKNSFDLLRIVAAVSVLLLHFSNYFSTPLTGSLSPYTYFNGVNIFFVISGFLIPYSLEKTSDIKGFLKKRILRIYPGLWFAVIVSTIIIFVLYGIPLIKDAVAYFVTQFTFLRFYTIDWLRGYGVGCPNGALWTLFVELQYYIFVCIFYPRMKNKSNKLWFLAFVFACMLNVFPYLVRDYIPEIAGKFYGQLLLPYLWIFVLVMFIYKEREKIIPLLVKYYWLILLLTAGCLAVQMVFHLKIFGFSGKSIDVFSNTITITELVYIVFVIATAFKIKIKRWKIDFSYPLYLFHYIFINIAIHLQFESVIYSLAFVVVGSLLLSLVYIYVVEPCALKLINKIFKV